MEELFIFIEEQLWLVALLFILVGLFIRRESKSGGDKLSITEVVQAINSDKAVLIDVRERKEFDQGHVANAINIPHKKISDNLSQLEKHKSKQIIVADHLGQHAGSVGQILAKQGYNVARMRGGMSEWKQEGLPLVK